MLICSYNTTTNTNCMIVLYTVKQMLVEVGDIHVLGTVQIDSSTCF